MSSKLPRPTLGRPSLTSKDDGGLRSLTSSAQQSSIALRRVTSEPQWIQKLREADTIHPGQHLTPEELGSREARRRRGGSTSSAAGRALLLASHPQARS
jgi:hypothetical protein